MSNTKKSKEFYEMADAFIALANEKSNSAEAGVVSATFLYAAARFNTYLVASGSVSKNDFVSNKEKSMEYFMVEYKKMLDEHFADYGENYEKYLPHKDNSVN